jgi:hypothetical protein
VGHDWVHCYDQCCDSARNAQIGSGALTWLVLLSRSNTANAFKLFKHLHDDTLSSSTDNEIVVKSNVNGASHYKPQRLCGAGWLSIRYLRLCSLDLSTSTAMYAHAKLVWDGLSLNALLLASCSCHVLARAAAAGAHASCAPMSPDVLGSPRVCCMSVATIVLGCVTLQVIRSNHLHHLRMHHVPP